MLQLPHSSVSSERCQREACVLFDLPVQLELPYQVNGLRWAEHGRPLLTRLIRCREVDQYLLSSLHQHYTLACPAHAHELDLEQVGLIARPSRDKRRAG